jgi:outer membrane lipoprotein-sorting protein
MSTLRTISTSRLLALVGAVLAVVAAGTAIALAAGGEGPVPPPKPLATAVHDALAAPSVQGVTARIKFTNHLIDSASIEGSDPILTGATGRLWAADGRLRLELQSDQGDAQVVAEGKSFWVYDGKSNTAYRGQLPQNIDGDTAPGESHQVPSLERVQQEIVRLMKRADVSNAVPGDIASQPAYTVRISPKQDGGLLGAGELAWDAVRGLPLRLAVFAKGNDSPVLELTATDISYGSVPASVFDVSPPPDAKVVDLSPQHESGDSNHGDKPPVTGADAVGRSVPFKLSAPETLAGLPRQEVRLIDWSGSRGALATYGRGLGGIAVIERAAESAKSSSNLNLPDVTINGATGQELATALGTIVQFERGGVSYTVLGSVGPSTAEAAARGL